MSARWKNNREYSFRIFAGCFVFGGGSDFPGASFLFDFPPVHQCVSNRQFIYVFQFVAEADPPGDRRDFHLRVLAQPVEQIEQGCFAFDRGRDGEDHFPDRSLGDPLDQQVDLQGPKGRCPASERLHRPIRDRVHGTGGYFRSRVRRRPVLRHRRSYGRAPGRRRSDRFLHPRGCCTICSI